MRLVRLVPVLCCLLPLQGLAQSEIPAPPLISAPGAPGEGEATSPAEGMPRGEIIPPEERLRSDDTGSPAIRIPVSTLLGTGGALLGSIPGLVIIATQFCLDSCSDDQSVEILGLVVAAAGGVIAGTWTIDRTGDWLGGQGEFWPTALGMVLGTLAGAGVAVAIAPSSEGAAVIPAVLGPALGGAIAYELSSTQVRSQALAATASLPRIAPLVAVSPRGGFIGGIAGSF
jgi:hypothetical protein